MKNFWKTSCKNSRRIHRNILGEIFENISEEVGGRISRKNENFGASFGGNPLKNSY